MARKDNESTITNMRTSPREIRFYIKPLVVVVVVVVMVVVVFWEYGMCQLRNRKEMKEKE